MHACLLDPDVASLFQVVVTNGAKQAIAQVVIGVTGPGDEVVIPAPYWVSYPEMCRLSGAEPIIVTTRPEDGFIMTPVRALIAQHTGRHLTLLLSNRGRSRRRSRPRAVC